MIDVAPMKSAKPVICACGGTPRVSDYVGGFLDRDASVKCDRCCVGTSAGRSRDAASAIERWNALQSVLVGTGWKAPGGECGGCGMYVETCDRCYRPLSIGEPMRCWHDNFGRHHAHAKCQG